MARAGAAGGAGDDCTKLAACGPSAPIRPLPSVALLTSLGGADDGGPPSSLGVEAAGDNMGEGMGGAEVRDELVGSTGEESQEAGMPVTQYTHTVRKEEWRREHR